MDTFTNGGNNSAREREICRVLTFNLSIEKKLSAALTTELCKKGRDKMRKDERKGKDTDDDRHQWMHRQLQTS